MRDGIVPRFSLSVELTSLYVVDGQAFSEVSLRLQAFSGGFA